MGLFSFRDREPFIDKNHFKENEGKLEIWDKLRGSSMSLVLGMRKDRGGP